MTQKLMFALIMAIMMSNNVRASDCGWVLWANFKTVYKISFPTSPEDWLICDAFETIKECKQTKEEYLNLTLKKATDQKNNGKIADVMRRGDAVFILMKQEDNEIISKWESYYCLPGTLDPRGKLAKE